MRYFVINASNGYCGFEDKWVVKTEDDSWEPSEGGYILDTYVYAEGGGGLDPYDGEEYDSYDDYVEDIYDNTVWEEITEEEFNQLLNEEGLEERQW